MIPESNPVHACHRCQSYLAQQVDPDELDGPAHCDRWPVCATVDGVPACQRTTCSGTS